MLRKSYRRLSIALSSVWLVVGVVMFLCPAPSLAQEQLDTTHCDSIRNEVPPLLENALATGEGLEELAARAKEAKACYGNRLDAAWTIWLLDARVYALNELQRYSEAQEVVTELLTSYITQADSADVARFFMSQLRFQYRQGDFESAMETYKEGLLYALKLPEERYKPILRAVFAAYGSAKQPK